MGRRMPVSKNSSVNVLVGLHTCACRDTPPVEAKLPSLRSLLLNIRGAQSSIPLTEYLIRPSIAPCFPHSRPLSSVPFFPRQHPVSFTFRFPLVHFSSSRQPNLYDGRISGGSCILFKPEQVRWVNTYAARPWRLPP